MILNFELVEALWDRLVRILPLPLHKTVTNLPGEGKVMGRRALAILMAVGVFSSGCSDSTGPEIFAISGTWTSVNFPDAEFSMTVVETARAVEGAGHRLQGDDAVAFRVYGANAGQRASLLLDFEEENDVNFEGAFSRGDENGTLLEGMLFGGGYVGEAVTFQRVE